MKEQKKEKLNNEETETMVETKDKKEKRSENHKEEQKKEINTCEDSSPDSDSTSDSESNSKEKSDKEENQAKKVEAVLEKDTEEKEEKNEVKADVDKIAKLTKELAEEKNKYYRALADYQNLQRRSSKEQLEARGRGIEDFVKKLLPILDTLDKAMEEIYKHNPDKKIIDGLEMFNIQFTDVLEKEGLKPISALGCKFDPNFHEALSKQSNPSSEDDVVLDEYEKGYIFKERVLRTSKVVINQL